MEQGVEGGELPSHVWCYLYGLIAIVWRRSKGRRDVVRIAFGQERPCEGARQDLPALNPATIAWQSLVDQPTQSPPSRNVGRNVIGFDSGRLCHLRARPKRGCFRVRLGRAKLYHLIRTESTQKTLSVSSFGFFGTSPVRPTVYPNALNVGVCRSD